MTPSPKTWLWTMLLAVIVGATLPAPALAQVYVRAGLMLDRTEDTRFQDEACASQKALYPCEQSPLGDFGTMVGLELGLGYALLPALRLEAALQYRPDFDFKGRADSESTARVDVSADLSATSGMLTAYLDVPMPNFGLLWLVPVNPFIGVGGGLSRIEIADTRLASETATTIVSGDDQTSFSWMASAGLAVSLSRWLAVEVAWRYTDHGDVETAAGAGQVRDFDLGKMKGALRGHGVVASLRYTF